jgi:hypothetical protein
VRVAIGFLARVQLLTFLISLIDIVTLIYVGSNEDSIVSEVRPLFLYAMHLFLSADDESVHLLLHVPASYEEREYRHESGSIATSTLLLPDTEHSYQYIATP